MVADRGPYQCELIYAPPEVLNSYVDDNLVLELKARAESELRYWKVFKLEQAAVLLRRPAPPDYCGDEARASAAQPLPLRRRRPANFRRRQREGCRSAQEQ